MRLRGNNFMNNPDQLRPAPELRALGASDELIEALGAQAITDRDGMFALRRGIIDAARVIGGDIRPGEELDTPEELRADPVYKMGYAANSTIIFEKKAAATERMAA
jgi:hypothetical protein